MCVYGTILVRGFMLQLANHNRVITQNSWFDGMKKQMKKQWKENTFPSNAAAAAAH